MKASSPYDLPCVVLAGGLSRRFGSPKGLAMLGDLCLMDWVLGALSGQTAGPVAINTPPGILYTDRTLHVIEDKLRGDIGPLAGLHAAMVWAGALGFERVVTASVDVPFLPVDFISSLAGSPGTSVAASRSGLHPICGCWETHLAHDLELAIGDGLRAARDWVAACAAKTVAFEATRLIDPFFNINTPEDLAHAKALLNTLKAITT